MRRIIDKHWNEINRNNKLFRVWVFSLLMMVLVLLSSTKSFTASTADQYLEFLKEQTANHQSFIEREREFLVWMLGVISLIAVGVLAFFGYKRKKDIKELVDAEYRKNIKKIVNSTVEFQLGEIFDEDRVKYVKYLADREMRAKQKKICFIQQQNKKELEPVIKKYQTLFGDEHKEHVYIVKYTKGLFKSLLADEESSELNEADIIVFQVSEKEKRIADSSDQPNALKGIADNTDQPKTKKRIIDSTDQLRIQKEYQKIDEYCEQKKKECVLYCNDFEVEIKELVVSTPVKTFASLIRNINERLYD